MMALSRKHRFLHSACLALLAGLSAVVACERREAPTPAPNVVFIVIDTLRADRLGAYGNERGLTPFLDSMAERGFVFRNAYAQSSWTKPSIASILTSRFPVQHGVQSWKAVLPSDEITLPEILQSIGYATAAFQANILVNAGQGFGQGFAEYHLYPLKGGRQKGLVEQFHERAGTLNRDALAWLVRQKPQVPLFVYLQYMEPHLPWAPPDAILDRVVGDRPRPDVRRLNAQFLVARRDPLSPETWDAVRDAYDAEVMALDRDLEALFAELEKSGFLEHCIVVITSDHGEELGEHGLAGHGISLFNEEIRVPLIVVPPWRQTRVDVDDIASLIDVAPTVLALVGVPAPDAFEGKILDRVLAGAESIWTVRTLPRVPGMGSTHPSSLQRAYSSLTQASGDDDPIPRYNRIVHREALVMGAEKVVRTASDGLAYYRLDEDPKESDPRAVDGSTRADLRQAMEQAHQDAGRAAAASEVQPVSEEMRARLQALGYAH